MTLRCTLLFIAAQTTAGGSAVAARTTYVANREQLTERRERAGLNRTQLAAKTRTSFSMIAAVERGDRQPSPALVKKLAKALGCTFDDLVLRREPEPVAS